MNYLSRLIELDVSISKFLLTNPDKRPGALEAIRRWRARQVKPGNSYSPFANTALPSVGTIPRKIIR